ncbi:MAG TPA: RecX family transcriptional regulator [Haploplasma sp.]|nr:RecX family transcriptional regulator [Haploplasma sp.]
MVKIIKKLRHYTEVEIDQVVYNIENEVVYKYQINNGSTIDKERLKVILDDNKYYYYDRIAKNKLKKPMSEKQMIDFLTKERAPKKLIEQLINNYKDFNYLNDDSYVSSYLEFSKKREGPKLMAAKLKSKGINNEVINEQLDRIDEKDIIEDIVSNTLNKKITKNKVQHTNGLKASLINKGYSNSLVFEIVDRIYLDVEVDETEFIKKDYHRLVNRYKDKKEGNELTYFIKSKLYEKGYSSSSITKILEDN